MYIVNYVNKQITLPEDLMERLKQEKNASQVIASALILYFEKQDSVKRLVTAAVNNEQLVNEFGHLRTRVDRVIELVERATGR